MIHLHFSRFKLKNTAELALVRLFYTLSLAFTSTIWSIYMKSFGLTDSQIGYLDAILIIISIIFLFVCVNILEKYLESKSFIIAQILIIITLIFFGIVSNLYLFLILAIFISLLRILRENSFNILFRDNSNNNDLNKDEAFLSVIANIAWFLGPILAGLLFITYNFSTIFYISSFFVLFSLLIFLKIPKSQIIKPKYTKKSFNFLIKNFISKKEIYLPYIMSIGISFWWAIIFIYMPLFILESGIGEEYIGYFIGLTQLPLILFEYYAGNSSSKNGFRRYFFFGYLTIGLLAISCFFISNIYIIMLILITASIPMSFVEPLRQTFLFKQLSQKDEEDIVPLFFSSSAIGGLLTKIIIATLLLRFTSNYAYLVMGIGMIMFGLIALKIKK